MVRFLWVKLLHSSSNIVRDIPFTWSRNYSSLRRTPLEINYLRVPSYLSITTQIEKSFYPRIRSNPHICPKFYLSCTRSYSYCISYNYLQTFSNNFFSFFSFIVFIMYPYFDSFFRHSCIYVSLLQDYLLVMSLSFSNK